MDFGLAKYDLNAITQRIDLPEITPTGAPVLTLIVKCERNRAFANALFKRAHPKDAPAEPPPDATALTPADDEAASAQRDVAAREQLAAMYAGTVVVGWENATSGGEPVAFSVEACRDFIAQLLEHCPDVWNTRVRDFVAEVANFRPVAPTVDPADLGKGPPRG